MRNKCRWDIPDSSSNAPRYNGLPLHISSQLCTQWCHDISFKQWEYQLHRNRQKRTSLVVKCLRPPGGSFDPWLGELRSHLSCSQKDEKHKAGNNIVTHSIKTSWKMIYIQKSLKKIVKLAKETKGCFTPPPPRSQWLNICQHALQWNIVVPIQTLKSKWDEPKVRPTEAQLTMDS